jgi:hypothetical protein
VDDKELVALYTAAAIFGGQTEILQIKQVARKGLIAYEQLMYEMDREGGRDLLQDTAHEQD